MVPVPLVHKRREELNLGFILLSLFGLALSFGFVHVCDKMDSEREFAARQKQNGIQRFSDNTFAYSDRG